MKGQGCSPALSDNRLSGCWACCAGWLCGRSCFWYRAVAAPPAIICAGTDTGSLDGASHLPSEAGSLQAPSATPSITAYVTIISRDTRTARRAMGFYSLK